jgi:hypothetical protein
MTLLGTPIAEFWQSPPSPSSLQTAWQLPQLPFWERWHLLLLRPQKAQPPRRRVRREKARKNKRLQSSQSGLEVQALKVKVLTFLAFSRR